MRTVLLCRDGADQRHLAARLADAGVLDAIVVESRGDARRAKLTKALRKGNPLLLPVRILDTVAVVLYGNWSEKVIATGLGATEYPAGTPRLDVGNANDPESVETLKQLEPDVLLVLGTGILRDNVLAIAKSYSLNIHGGALPEYRNVYSDFWALVNGDLDRVGSVVFHLDPGVDTGDIALGETIDLSRGWSSFGEIKLENARLRVRIAIQALEQARAGALPRTPQEQEKGRNWYAPTAAQLVRGLWKIRRRQKRALRSAKSNHGA